MIQMADRSRILSEYRSCGLAVHSSTVSVESSGTFLLAPCLSNLIRKLANRFFFAWIYRKASSRRRPAKTPESFSLIVKWVPGLQQVSL